MATNTTSRIIENGARDFIGQFVFYDTAPAAATVEETAVVKVSAANLGFVAGQAAHMKVRRILYTVSNCNVQIQWKDGTATTKDVAFLGGPSNDSGDHNLDFYRSGSQGIFNDTGNPTGDIIFTTTAVLAVATGGFAGYTITLFITKGIGF